MRNLKSSLHAKFSGVYDLYSKIKKLKNIFSDLLLLPWDLLVITTPSTSTLRSPVHPFTTTTTIEKMPFSGIIFGDYYVAFRGLLLYYKLDYKWITIRRI
jgi:hypothetical protein